MSEKDSEGLLFHEGGDLYSAGPGISGDRSGGGASSEETVRGHVLRIIFTSDDGSYSVAKIRDGSGLEIVLVGLLTGIAEGLELEATGRWETHREHGLQFRVSACHPILPTTETGLIQYLSSGVLPGVGKAFATRIVRQFGTDTLEILDSRQDRLSEVPGLGRKKIDQISRAWNSASRDRETMIYLQGLGITPAYASRIIREYYPNSPVDVIRNNPYRLIADIDGIGFRIADRIAFQLDIANNHPKRLCAGIVFALEENAARGNTCSPEQQLLQEAAEILNVTPAEAAEGLKVALQENKVIREQFLAGDGSALPFLYLRRLKIAESELAACAVLLFRSSPPPLQYTPAMPAAGKLQLNAGQQQAVDYAMRYGCSIITGGPGVGKTTVVSRIVELGKALHLRLRLAAPTGRAAKRLSEATGCEAFTIHRLLKWDSREKCFVHNQDKPLSCDMLIVDEASMLDVNLANHLFQAIQPGTRLILVGDKDQLPSVGPGNVLHDFIFSGFLPVTHLTEIYRQARGSRIILNAHAVNQGCLPDLRPAPPESRPDFYWIEQDNPDHVADLICRMVAQRIPRAFGFDAMNDVQILSPMRKGVCGVTVLNERLQEALNPLTMEQRKPDRCFLMGSRDFRLGDRVMQLSNNYDKGVYNGDMGHIVAIDGTARKFTVSYDRELVDYDQTEADQLSLAYAVTVHKSQGSEFPVVVMPVLTQHFVMLQRNLLYTGMTRAKKILIMIGSRRAVETAVRNNEPMRRMSMLNPRMVYLQEKSLI